MTFEHVVKKLRTFHQALWFCCSSSPEKLFHADCWKGGMITTTGGKFLAFQIGGPDEWELSSVSDQPDTGLIIDEPDAESEITDGFLDEVRFYMQMYVQIDWHHEAGI
ncbi:hypothetical protein [Escherichia coli]|uniref:hypothetical protein n=2 Tax=Escherichia coli TaxID=562 RepID=UPI00128215A4|nr:hypothetical protein [Escherichia coli]EAO6910739.1 hypothetical protein [Salmonella enterica]EDA9004453.1 hypothetical protein [Salmonella enterica subsp. enterica serovar Bareilly]HAE7834601.1 hypothetical protein [Salmonella enterica subsp. enterica serovar Worthington]EEY6643899.1 hypothetical protein [Escherichia coli]EFH5946370.1 hypothetical protein [Escherichia coli]